MLGLGAFDERDGARQHGSVAGANAIDVVIEAWYGGGSLHRHLLESYNSVIVRGNPRPQGSRARARYEKADHVADNGNKSGL
jgi:hypothetical protein